MTVLGNEKRPFNPTANMSWHHKLRHINFYDSTQYDKQCSRDRNNKAWYPNYIITMSKYFYDVTDNNLTQFSVPRLADSVRSEMNHEKCIVTDQNKHEKTALDIEDDLDKSVGAFGRQ